MAKVSLVIIPSRPNRHGECVVMLQISALLKTIRVPTDVTVLKENWLKTGQVLGGKTGDKLAASKNIRLTQIKNGCDLKIINNQDKVDLLEVDQLKNFLLSEKEVIETDFFIYGEKRIKELKSLKNDMSANLLNFTMEKVHEFWGKGKLDFNEITVRFLEQFESYCLKTPRKTQKKYKPNEPKEVQKPMQVNGIAVYMRYVRSVMNGAISDNLTINYPFRKFKIKTEVTRNRNLPIKSIRAIRDFTSTDKRQEIARDVFMLQFFLLGINIKDLFFLTSKNVIDGRIQYFRAKTGRFYNIKIEKEAQAILDRYKGGKYLLWFADLCLTERESDKIKHSRASEFQYKDETAFGKMVNKNLSLIQSELKINQQVKITTYYCRHSVASIMRELSISIDDISLCLGHSSPDKHVTRIYINEDFIRADKANRKLLDYLKKDPKVDETTEKSKKKKKTSPVVA
ncbi:MAG TPA: site-specific integrase [Prolixibacteraceae bacterium]